VHHLATLWIYGVEDGLKTKVIKAAKKMGQSESAVCRFILKKALEDNPWLWQEVIIKNDVETEDDK